MNRNYAAQPGGIIEFVRYIIVFFAVGWGGGIISAILFLVLLPLLSRLRGTTAGRCTMATSNGVATLLAVYLAYLACDWTGGDANYLMFVIAFWAMLSNDLWRIKRAKVAYSVGGQILDENPSLRVGLVQSEQMNLIADVVGFAVGLTLIPMLSFV